jgi:putative membrane protein
VSEPLVRQWAGFGSVLIETAAARSERGGTQRSEAMVPVVDKARLHEIVRYAVPTVDVDINKAELNPPHVYALVRAFVRGSFRSTLFAAAVSWLFWPWGMLMWLAVPLSWFFAYLDYRVQGWLVTDQVIIARKGYWHRRSVIVSRDKLQSVDVSQGPFMRRFGLGQLSLKAAGTAVALPVTSWKQAQDLLYQLSASRK